MLNVFIAGAFALLGAAVGAAGVIIINLLLRKEKFKEIVYKEQLAAHKEIAEARGKIFSLFAESLKDRKKVYELKTEALKLGDFFLRNAIFISGEVRESTADFVTAAIETFKDRKKEEIVAHDPAAQAVIVNEKYHAATNVSRKELGIEPLTESITKTFKF